MASKEAILRILILMIIIFAGTVDSASRTYRSRRYKVSTGLDTWMIVVIIVGCLSILAVPVVLLICIKCGCCKVKQKTHPDQHEMVSPGQQYGQPGAPMYGQTQYGQPIQYGQPTPYRQPNGFGQQTAFGQPAENQFPYSSQKY